MSPSNDIDYKKNIMNLLLKNVAGLTITDISEKLGISRNTVYRYIGLLVEKGKVQKKKIGAYTLYFTAETETIPKGLVFTFYLGYLSTFKDNFKNVQESYKQLGKIVAQKTQFPIGTEDSETTESLGKYTNHYFMEIFGKMWPYFDPLPHQLDVLDIKIDGKENKAIYHFGNAELLEFDPDFIIHFYVVSGYVEHRLKAQFNKDVKCDILEYNASKNREECYVKISLELVK
jgi:DNA-binding Lrp family transcriptional regulator